ncbi:hypothetical protein [Pseudoalteromonas pernae]|uniref:hypothetical protein n=1 Tax=Pseudoalteromonas pernae TaxID=3118054 RepID=UPI003242C815
MKNDELQRYKDDLWEMEARLKRKSRVEQILKLYMIMGALIGIFSLSYFLLSFLEVELSQTQMMTLASAGLGVALSLASWAMLVFRKQRELEESEKLESLQSATKLMYLWSEFEFSAKNRLESEGIDYSKHSIRSVLSSLFEHEFLSKKDLMMLEDAMQLRNSIAHSRLGSELSPELIDRTSKVLIDSINKLDAK